MTMLESAQNISLLYFRILCAILSYYKSHSIPREDMTSFALAHQKIKTISDALSGVADDKSCEAAHLQQKLIRSITDFATVLNSEGRVTEDALKALEDASSVALSWLELPPFQENTFASVFRKKAEAPTDSYYHFTLLENEMPTLRLKLWLKMQKSINKQQELLKLLLLHHKETETLTDLVKINEKNVKDLEENKHDLENKMREALARLKENPKDEDVAALVLQLHTVLRETEEHLLSSQEEYHLSCLTFIQAKRIHNAYRDILSMLSKLSKCELLFVDAVESIDMDLICKAAQEKITSEELERLILFSEDCRRYSEELDGEEDICSVAGTMLSKYRDLLPPEPFSY